MARDSFDHIEQCNEPLITTRASELQISLDHIMKPLVETDFKSICYDLKDCESVDPGAVLLLCYAYELSQLRGKQIRISGQGELIEELREHFTHYQVRDPAQRTSSNRTGLYPLRGIESKDSMLTELQAWAESVQQGTSATPEQVALWQMQIAEVTTNAFQHGPVHKTQSPGPTCIVAGKAVGTVVQLAALDFGSTIPLVIEKVARAKQIPMHDGELIRFACQKGVTSRSVKQNQGAGLHSLRQTVTASPTGILQILSRNGLAYFSNGQEFVRNLEARADGSASMDGTLTIINLEISGETQC